MPARLVNSEHNKCKRCFSYRRLQFLDNFNEFLNVSFKLQKAQVLGNHRAYYRGPQKSTSLQPRSTEINVLSSQVHKINVLTARVHKNQYSYGPGAQKSKWLQPRCTQINMLTAQIHWNPNAYSPGAQKSPSLHPWCSEITMLTSQVHIMNMLSA